MNTKVPYTLKTPRGNFTIEKVFPNKAEASKEGFGYYFTYQGKDILIKSNTQTWHSEFGIIEK